MTDTHSLEVRGVTLGYADRTVVEDLDLALEIATSMGSMPGTTICGLADGNNWATRTIMNKYRDEFEKRVKRTFVPVSVSVGAH